MGNGQLSDGRVPADNPFVGYVYLLTEKAAGVSAGLEPVS
jgi:hypothetical protein